MNSLHTWIPCLVFPKVLGSNWQENGSPRPVRPLSSILTADLENHPLGATRTTSTPTNLTTISHSPFGVKTNEGDGPTLPLVERANRAEIHQRQQCVEAETSEGLNGDIEWVRSGGDFVRTKRIPDEPDEQERERKALTTRTEYEDRCTLAFRLVASVPRTGHDQDQGVGFGDIAWPVASVLEVLMG
jgi:hypothetical protein